MYKEGSPDIDYLDIHATFARTEYGKTLHENVRYDKYRPPDIGHDRWEELLGPDVNNLNHLVDTYHLTCGFVSNTDRLQPGLLIPREKAVLKVSSVIHDWDESINTDINYFEKTEAHEIAERRSFVENLPNFYTGNDPEVQDLIDEAVNEVIFDPESRLGSMFNVIERVGYLRTGLRAARLAIEHAAPDCEDNLRWLSAAVFSSDHPASLIAKGRQLFAAHQFLYLRQAEITEAYETIAPDIFAAHEPPREASARVEGLHEARLIWNAWCAGFDSAIR